MLDVKLDRGPNHPPPPPPRALSSPPPYVTLISLGSQAGVLHGHQAYGTAFGEEFGSADRVHLCCQVGVCDIVGSNFLFIYFLSREEKLATLSLELRFFKLYQEGSN